MSTLRRRNLKKMKYDLKGHIITTYNYVLMIEQRLSLILHWFMAFFCVAPHIVIALPNCYLKCKNEKQQALQLPTHFCNIAIAILAFPLLQPVNFLLFIFFASFWYHFFASFFDALIFYLSSNYCDSDISSSNYSSFMLVKAIAKRFL